MRAPVRVYCTARMPGRWYPECMGETGIVVRLFAGLERDVPGVGVERWLSAAEAPSVAAVLESLGLHGRAGLVLVNGVHAGPAEALAPGDEVDLFPPIGGG